MTTLRSRLWRRFLRFRRELLVMGFALLHPGTPTRLKLAGGAVLLYLLSPLDLVSIVVPLLGVLDDALLVPWGVGAVVRRLPEQIRVETEARATRFIARYVKRPVLVLVLVLVALVSVWAALLWLFWRTILG
jgi:uncharacterized membrane protein YkvA (DUF1232 family)